LTGPRRQPEGQPTPPCPGNGNLRHPPCRRQFACRDNGVDHPVDVHSVVQVVNGRERTFARLPRRWEATACEVRQSDVRIAGALEVVADFGGPFECRGNRDPSPARLTLKRQEDRLGHQACHLRQEIMRGLRLGGDGPHLSRSGPPIHRTSGLPLLYRQSARHWACRVRIGRFSLGGPINP